MLFHISSDVHTDDNIDNDATLPNYGNVSVAIVPV